MHEFHVRNLKEPIRRRVTRVDSWMDRRTDVAQKCPEKGPDDGGLGRCLLSAGPPDAVTGDITGDY
jgi:hypothetical protein